MNSSRINGYLVWLLHAGAALSLFFGGALLLNHPAVAAAAAWFGCFGFIGLTARSVELQRENESLHELIMPEERVPTIPSGPPAIALPPVSLPPPPRLPSFSDSGTSWPPAA